MPNIKSAKKALRGSQRKAQHNNFWKNRIKISVKKLTSSLETGGSDVAILNENLVSLQKVLDKASKNKVLHKNRANRLKSRYARKVSAQTQKDSKGSSKQDSKKESTK